MEEPIPLRVRVVSVRRNAAPTICCAQLYPIHIFFTSGKSKKISLFVFYFTLKPLRFVNSRTPGAVFTKVRFSFFDVKICLFNTVAALRHGKNISAVFCSMQKLFFRFCFHKGYLFLRFSSLFILSHDFCNVLRQRRFPAPLKHCPFFCGFYHKIGGFFLHLYKIEKRA